LVIVHAATCLPTRKTGVLAGKEKLYRAFTFKSARMRWLATTSIKFNKTQFAFHPG
jgi:hypothetical protein